MEMSISHRTQYHGITDDRNEAGGMCGAKINNEMSYAIRRQRETSGVDYFKQVPATKLHLQTEKKGFSNRIQSVNLDGNYLPQFSISSQLKTDRNNNRHVQKAGKFGSFNRSKSSVSLSLPSGKHLSPGQSSPHNVVVTDLTCLQLADTLFSSNLSLGLTNNNTERMKYTHYNGDRKTSFVTEYEKNFHTNFKNGPYTQLPSLSVRTRPESGNRRHRPDSSSKFRNENNRPSSAGGVKRVYSNPLHSEKEIMSPKSILKQNSVGTQTENYSKRTKYRTISDKLQKKTSCPDQSKYITIKASKIGLQCQNNATAKTCSTSMIKAGTLDFDDKDIKRSVRFNISNEIFEYIPHEPVWN